MDKQDRKAKVRAYVEQARSAGVFAVRNLENGRVLFGASPDVPGMPNRQRFRLDLGSHPDRDLQSGWKALGPDAFAFESPDLLESDTKQESLADDLRVLKALWLDKLAAAGTPLYNWSRTR